MGLQSIFEGLGTLAHYDATLVSLLLLSQMSFQYTLYQQYYNTDLKWCYTNGTDLAYGATRHNSTY
eukprot:3941941-Rhodomonas_salina.6